MFLSYGFIIAALLSVATCWAGVIVLVYSSDICYAFIYLLSGVILGLHPQIFLLVGCCSGIFCKHKQVFQVCFIRFGQFTVLERKRA